MGNSWLYIRALGCVYASAHVWIGAVWILRANALSAYRTHVHTSVSTSKLRLHAHVHRFSFLLQNQIAGEDFCQTDYTFRPDKKSSPIKDNARIPDK